MRKKRFVLQRDRGLRARTRSPSIFLRLRYHKRCSFANEDGMRSFYIEPRASIPLQMFLGPSRRRAFKLDVLANLFRCTRDQCHTPRPILRSPYLAVTSSLISRSAVLKFRQLDRAWNVVLAWLA